MDNYKLYITIVEQGSFSKAAEKLGITQPTVSKQIDRLEDKLGCQLFKRSTRKLLLTAAGERYYERAIEIDALVMAAEHEIRHISSHESSLLRIEHLQRWQHTYCLPCYKNYSSNIPRRDFI